MSQVKALRKTTTGQETKLFRRALKLITHRTEQCPMPRLYLPRATLTTERCQTTSDTSEVNPVESICSDM